MSYKKLIWVLLLTPATLQAQPPSRVLDQNQPNTDTAVGSLAIGGGAASEQKLAQTVTVGRAGTLTEVRLPVACANGSLIVEIQGVAPDGKPDGVVQARRRVPARLLPATSPPAFQTFRFGSRLSFDSGDRFAIVLMMRDPIKHSCGAFKGPDRNPYAGGEVYFDARPNAPGWIRTFDDRDLPFETLMLVR